MDRSRGVRTAPHATLGVLQFLGALILCAPPASSAAQQWCEDTQFHDTRHPDAYASRYHVVEAYGDLSHRSTNFYEPNYNGLVSSSTVRLLFPRLSEVISTRIPLPDVVTGITATSLDKIEWENRTDLSAGLEWRPFDHETLPLGVAQWLYHVRVYALVFGTHYNRFTPEEWRARNDVRFGLGLYRECNLYRGSRAHETSAWTETWADASWRKTNFTVQDFNAPTFSAVSRVGVRFPTDRWFALMPYGMGEFDVTSRSEFWQNAVFAGGGIRMMPFRSYNGAFSDVLRATRVYGETMTLVYALKGSPTTGGPPSHDVRLGATIIVNRWR
jgi:hypothetical protein